jgi:isopenicillin N synthase-like dioxygenase
MRMENLACLIGEGIASSLGSNPALFRTQFRRQTLGINYYPACPQPELTLGLSSHSDFGSLSILMQKAKGLQVKRGEHWLDVDPIPNTFVVLIGDQIEVSDSSNRRID